MKKVFILIFVAILIASALKAQDKKVAVFDPAGTVDSNIKDVVREEISSVIVNASGYVVLERQLINKVLEENKFQTGGMVDDSQISEMGRMMGANYVFVSSITDMGNNTYYISFKMIDVTTARIEKQKTATTARSGLSELIATVQKTVTEMIRDNPKPTTNITTPTPTPNPVVVNNTPIEKTTEKSSRKYLPFSFGIELGGGVPANFDFGIRLTKNFVPYFGLDILKLKYNYTYLSENNIARLGYNGDYTSNSIQVLFGIRGATPHFGSKKTTNIYSSLRFGCGYFLDTDWYNDNGWLATINNSEGFYPDGTGSSIDNYYAGFCMEWDLGIHFRHFFFGTTLAYGSNVTFGLRLGIDIGRKKSY